MRSAERIAALEVALREAMAESRATTANNHAAVHAKAHNAWRALIHHHEHPNERGGPPIRTGTDRRSTSCPSHDPAP
jgi:hypothetical protein